MADESGPPETGGGTPFPPQAPTIMGNVEHSDCLLQFFKYDHLPPKLQAVSQPFGDLAGMIVLQLPRNPERTASLRKLLEAKDCAVRALLFQ